MNNKQLKDTAKKHVPKQQKGKHAIIAFVSGGIMGAIGQGLLYAYINMFGLDEKSAMPLVIVTVILVVALATGFGVYDTLAQKCGAGLFIPISGFANSLTSSALEGKSEGPIYGIGSNMFKLAGSVIVYGIVAAFVFGTLRYIMFGG